MNQTKMPDAKTEWQGPGASYWNGGFQDAFDGYEMDPPQPEHSINNSAYREGYRAGRKSAWLVAQEEA